MGGDFLSLFLPNGWAFATFSRQNVNCLTSAWGWVGIHGIEEVVQYCHGIHIHYVYFYVFLVFARSNYKIQAQ